ncbi:MAG: hypothetical protein F4X56_00240 [Gammaproteobacteria bacterium]|nr:hypothetical protein [Gammaproteobacteria bacterium]MYC24327.1 hypothetical protein [Gammaproteobacteria bacterium]
MSLNESDNYSGNRRHPNSAIPIPLSFGVAAQIACLVLPGIVMIPTVVFRTAGQPEGNLQWAVFASVAISGITAILQAQRIGRFGAGYILAVGPSIAAIAVSIAALAAGGPALLATLVVCYALIQVLFSTHLSVLRRILTPTVTGTVLMLTPITIMPILFNQSNIGTSDSPLVGAGLSALVTMVLIVGITLIGKNRTRFWGPVIGIVVGTIVGGMFGLYDVDRVAAASWIGIPKFEAVLLDLQFKSEFWVLLPAFILVALICTMQTISGAVGIQQVSWEANRAVDFRAVQGAVAGDAVGNLLSGLACTMPLGFRPSGAAMVEISGVSSRRIGVALGVLLIFLAFVPKALAVLLAIPSPVVAAFITVTMATIFVIGARVIIQDGIDYRKGLIVGISFWLGVGFQTQAIFLDQAPEFVRALLQNGMLAGGIVAVALTMFLELTKSRRHRLEVGFDDSALREMRDFLGALALRKNWNTELVERLNAVCEEIWLTLHRKEALGKKVGRRLLLTTYNEDRAIVLEFVSSKGEENIQDRIALLGEANAAAMVEQDISLRLLRHLASSVRHQQYHETEIVTVRVDYRQNRSDDGT